MQSSPLFNENTKNTFFSKPRKMPIPHPTLLIGITTGWCWQLKGHLNQLTIEQTLPWWLMGRHGCLPMVA